MLHACYLLFIMCLCMSVKSLLYVVLTMPTLNKAYLYLFIYLFIYEHQFNTSEIKSTCNKTKLNHVIVSSFKYMLI
jgi:hypothetical protein